MKGKKILFFFKGNSSRNCKAYVRLVGNKIKGNDT